MPRTDKLSTYRTTIVDDGANIKVTYVSTVIVETNGDNVTLRHGGWPTVTTKRKMCQASNQFGLRYCVYQRKGDWFVDVKNPAYDREAVPAMDYWKGLAIPFRDGMTFNRYTGAIVS